MPYAPAVVERTMKVQEVLLQALSGKLTWPQAEEILGWSDRTVRRWRLRYQRWGYDGLWDRRRRTPSPRRAPLAEVERILRLYRERYVGFNGRHCYDLARRDHAVTLSYSFIKRALQGAGLLPTRRARGRHRRRREPRPCFGELLHLDGSRHAWLALVPELRPTLITVVDDATKRLLYAQLLEGGESTAAVMTALRDVLDRYGLPHALYTVRAHWAVHTRTQAPRRTARSSRSWAERCTSWGSNTSWATRRRPVAVASGPTVRSRTGSSMNCAWPASARSRRQIATSVMGS